MVKFYINIFNGIILYLFKALLRFQSDSQRKPNPDTSEEDIEELKSILSSLDQKNNFDEYYRYI